MERGCVASEEGTDQKGMHRTTYGDNETPTRHAGSRVSVSDSGSDAMRQTMWVACGGKLSIELESGKQEREWVRG